MSHKLITTISLAVALATLGVASAAAGGPTKEIPPSAGMCNMLHANDNGLDGMMNDPHVFDIMIPGVEASLDAGCPQHP